MIEFKVEGMTCGGCAASVGKAIKSLDSAAEVMVDLPSKIVTVSTSKNTNEITRVIEEAGFAVLSAKSNA